MQTSPWALVLVLIMQVALLGLMVRNAVVDGAGALGWSCIALVVVLFAISASWLIRQYRRSRS
ncbi:hypothetical protein GCM10028777_02190 [Angustibacter speluncae]